MSTTDPALQLAAILEKWMDCRNTSFRKTLKLSDINEARSYVSKP